MGSFLHPMGKSAQKPGRIFVIIISAVMNAQACESLKDLLRKNVVNSVDLKSYKEKGISFSYYYYSKASGKVRFQARFTPEDYDSNYSPAR